MNSFTLTAVGNLARNPEAIAKGDVTYTRFMLVGNDYAGKDEKGSSRELVTSLWFVAFGPLGEALVRKARKGDQLIIEAQVRANNWTDKQGEKQYDHDFIVQGFRFGAPGKAKRDELSSNRDAGKSDADSRSSEANASGDAKGNAEAKGSPESKAREAKLVPEGESDAAASTNGNGKTGSATHEKQSAQRTGRRTTAPPS
jgi:single-strand DNA-binding protein